MPAAFNTSTGWPATAPSNSLLDGLFVPEQAPAGLGPSDTKAGCSAPESVEIFKANNGQLVSLFKGLQHEESQLEKISRSKVLDESQIDNQIERVMQVRGDLEKANTPMLLEIRKQMTPEKTAKLDDHRPGPSQSEN